MPQPITGPVTSNYSGAPSPTSTIHVGDGLMTFASHVENPLPFVVNHVGGITLVSTSHINVAFPTSIHHVGYESLTYSIHVESMSPAIVNNVGGIEKPRRLKRKPKFLCRTYKGDHLTHLCPATIGIPEAWGSPKGPLDSEEFVVSPHPIPPFIDTAIISLQSSPEHPPPIVEVGVHPIPVIAHPLQPIIEEVVVPVQSLVNPTLLVEVVASFNHVAGILDPTPS
jgi:hypothetical protein